ncbi:MAG: transglutaminase-like domain-containing protein, partial [Thermodesulfovibrionales bacterium]|nr:transglutaminase-like domain-containing protein [Thermodesulfovibrionales bacterium]
MMTISGRKISYAGIFIFWFIAMAVLLFRHYGLNQNIAPAAYKAVIPDELLEEQWMGVYYKGEKIGYASRKIEKKAEGYKVSELLKMRLNVMDTQKEIETITNAFLDSGLRLKSFDFALKSDANMIIRGRVEDKNLNVEIETPGAKSEKVIHLKDAPSLNLSVIPDILKQGLKTGRKFNMAIIDPATLTQENMFIEVTGKEPITAMGIKQDAFKVKGTFKGTEFLMWLTGKGEVLREESPMGFTLIKEAKENAMRIERPSLDLIAQVAVPFNLNLPRDTNYLKVMLSGIDFKGLELDGGRQHFKGNMMEIRKEDFKKGSEGQRVKVNEEYLKDTMFVQSKDPQIVALAKDIVKGEKDKLKAARLIYGWVYKNIEKVPTITIPMATEVLKTKRGDCNEHTALYTALARAAGIPTRIALGLTYKDGFFYYHAWPEIFVKQWIAVDPTLG